MLTKTAAAPKPAPKPAARPVLLDPPPPEDAEPVNVEEAPAAVPELADELAAVVDTEVELNELEVVCVFVLVPSDTRGLAVKAAVVLVNPGQLVLPITVMVDG